MSKAEARSIARELLKVIPLVMRTIAADLRAAGELPASAHFGLLMHISTGSRKLTDIAAHQGVSLPTVSNSVSALVERGWVRRLAPAGDRRVVVVELTAAGKNVLDRVGRLAEGHLADMLAPLDPAGRRNVQHGLAVLRQLFEGARAVAEPKRPRRGAAAGLRTGHRK